MENITIGQVVAFITLLASLAGSCKVIREVYKKTLGAKLKKVEKIDVFEVDIEESKKDRKETREILEAIKESNLAIVRSQIVSKCEEYMKRGNLPEYARYCLEELHGNYKKLGGNHGIDILVDNCFELPSKKEGDD